MNNIFLDSINLLRFLEIDSTNEEAKRQIVSGAKMPMLIVADSQTGGKGRLGRKFYSPKGTGLYMSYVYKLSGDIADNLCVTALSAVATAMAIEEQTGKKPLIKWVNDLYLEGKKVAGILTEAVTDKNGDTFIIIGIGVNITTKDFPREISNIAASIGDIDRDALAFSISENLARLINSKQDKSFMNYYRERSFVLGKEVQFTYNSFTEYGTAIEIDDNGALKIKMLDGSERLLRTGEITLRVKENP